MPEVIESGVAYLALKAAQKLYGKAPAALAADESERVQNMAQKQFELEARILSAPEARDAMVPPATLKSALQEIRGRYENEDDFADDLASNGLSEAEFAEALERELRVEAILEKVGTLAEQVTSTDVELYYQYHPDQFRRQETRLARHILVTINETIPENTRDAALKRITEIAKRLQKEPARFEEQALKHSECPTAMNGGLLGRVPRGQLYPELETVAFALTEGELSPIVESELGWHLIHCETIESERHSKFDEVRQTIRDHLEQQRRGTCQKSWINALRRQAVAAGLGRLPWGS